MTTKHSRKIAVILALLTLVTTLFGGMTSVFADSSVTQNNLIANSSFEASIEPSKEVAGWTLGDGFAVSSVGAAEGSNMLTHTGAATATATSDAFELEAGKSYYLMARLYKANASATAKVELVGASAQITTSAAGEWVYNRVQFNSGSAATAQVKLTAAGDVKFDDIIVAEAYAETDIERVVNGSFDAAGGWDDGLPLTNVNSIGGSGNACGPIISSQEVTVDSESWYLFSADIYRDNLVTWKYLDMWPTAENVRLRGYREDVWESIGTLWHSGKNRSAAVRLVTEGGWDNVSVGSQSDVSKSYIDNVSFKKVKVSEELISDPDFTNNGWQIVSNGQISSTGNESTGSFKSTMTNASQGKAVAFANNGNAIPVDKNSTYVVSAWIRVDGGTRTLKTVLDMNDIPGELHIESTTYNHDSKGNYWVLLTGMWNSGNNTEVKLRASIEPTIASGAVTTAYIDTVSFRKAEPMEYGKNLVVNGGYEDYNFVYEVDDWSIPESGFALDHAAQHGRFAASLDNERMTSKAVSLKSGTQYMLSGWIKTDKKAAATISIPDLAFIEAKGTGDWEFVSTKFTVSGTNSYSISLDAQGGIAQFDNLYLDKVTNVYGLEGSKLSENAERFDLSSADTQMIVSVDNNKMYIEKMASAETGHEWVSPIRRRKCP